MRRWEFKRPILGRLVWGWLGFGFLSVVVGGWLFLGPSDRTEVGKIALDMDRDLNRLAPPEPLRLSPPSGAASVATGATVPSGDNAAQSRGLAPAAVAPTFASAGPKQISVPKDDDSTGAADETDETAIGVVDSAPGPADQGASNRFKTITVAEDADSSGAPGRLLITIDGRDVDAPGDAASDGVVPQRWAREPLRTASSALLQKTEFGAIPRIAADGRRPLEWYARPYEGNGPAFAIILTGLGSDAVITRAAIETLPGPVTLSFAPYAREAAAMMDLARQHGHEIMLDLPLEGYGQDAERIIGPAGLLTSRTASDNAKRLDWILSRGQSYIGLTNYQGAKFTGTPASMAPVLNRLTALGLAYVDDTGMTRAGDTTAPTVIRLTGTDEAALRRKLGSLTGANAPSDRVIIKLPANTNALAALNQFLGGLTEADRALAPVSALVY
ncbi:MAG: divergent polysaccharide deacetylase family protein [Pseudomonadota bacterium]